MKLGSILVSIVAVAVAPGLIGCSAESAENIEESSQQLGVNVPNPSGAYFASVTANGSGCPAGTWGADISPDGKAFTLTFSRYEASVSPGQSFVVKDCTIAIDLRTPDGYSFAVSSFHYQGYALLDQAGMSAKQTAKYYFQGNPVPAKEIRSDMVGPYDDSYVFSDDISVSDLVWSPCGATRRINAQTRLVLNNNPQTSGSGYLNTTSVDGEVKTVFHFGLTWRQCGSTPAGTNTIHRSFNAQIGDHLQTLTAHEGQPSWQYEGVSFRAFSADQGGSLPLVRCRLTNTAYHFISSSMSCEGQTSEGVLGWASPTPQPGLVQIWRCRNPRNSDHLTTANPTECSANGYVIEGSQGYVQP